MKYFAYLIFISVLLSSLYVDAKKVSEERAEIRKSRDYTCREATVKEIVSAKHRSIVVLYDNGLEKEINQPSKTVKKGSKHEICYYTAPDGNGDIKITRVILVDSNVKT